MQRLIERGIGIVACGLVALSGLCERASAQADALTRAAEAAYLSEDERRELRIEHGLWTRDDLRSPRDVARAALSSGAYDHPSLVDPETPAVMRAEGMVARGELEEALALLDGDASIRALRLAAHAHHLAGRDTIAAEVCDDIARQLLDRRVDDADDLADAVWALMLRQRLRGPEGVGDAARNEVQADFNVMLELLARARDELDRLNWRARLVEAELLLDKQRLEGAGRASAEALAYNPKCARALWVRGRILVMAYQLDAARTVADELDKLQNGVPRGVGGRSVYASDIRARAALRRGDEEMAIDAMDDTLFRFPQRREALALRCAVEAVGFDYGETDRLLGAFDEVSPGSSLALLEAGAALSEARQYEQSALYLERAVERAPTWAAPRLELGLMEMQSGRDSAAAIALERAVELDPFNTRADNSLKLIRELQSYVVVESEHFRVRAREGADSKLASEMLPVLERIHARVAGDDLGGVDHEPEGKTIIELMPDHGWFSVRITGMPEIFTIAAATGPVIAMEAPREGPGQSIGPYDWARVLQHEYAHTVTLSRTANRIPHWFTEAAAVYLEDAPFPSDWFPILTQAFVDGRLFTLDTIDFGFIRPERPTDRTLAYAQSAWIYTFMLDEWGNDAPLELMDLYAQGMEQPEAIQRVLGVPAEAFYAMFLERAEADLRAWGLILPDGMPSAESLVESIQKEGVDRVLPDLGQLLAWLEAHPEHPQLLSLAAGMASEGAAELDERALDLNMRLAAARPIDASPRKRLVMHALAVGDMSLAEEHLVWLDEREVYTPAYAAELARIYRRSGRMELAAEMIERASGMAPYDAHLREIAARDALLRGDLETAKGHIEMLTLLEPDVELHKERLEAIRGRMAAEG